jgi:putative hemolysin
VIKNTSKTFALLSKIPSKWSAKMKSKFLSNRSFFFLLILTILLALTLAGCQPGSDAPVSEDPGSSNETQPVSEGDVGLANPAAVFCQEQGYDWQVRTDQDGGQYGVCIFPDGSECDEWAFFNGQCSPGSEQGLVQPENQPSSQPVVAWVGHIASTPPGAQYDDYVILMPEGAGEIGIEGANEDIQAQIEDLRDAQGVQEYVHLWGTINCEVADYGGCQLLVSDVRFGQFVSDPYPVESWQGKIVCSHFNSSPDNQCGNAFMLAGDFPVWYGLWSSDPQIQAQFESLRDTEQVVQVWGEIVAGVPDVNGTQIRVNQITIP